MSTKTCKMTNSVTVSNETEHGKLTKQKAMNPKLSLADMAGEHPIISILFARTSEPEAYDPSSLQEFMNYELNNNAQHIIPYTMTDFYTDYLNFSIISYLGKNRGKYGPRHFRFNIRDILDRLAKLAYLSVVREVKISESMVVRAMPSLDVSERDIQKTADGNEETFPEPDLEFRTFGILKKEGNNTKNVSYVFHELCIRDYLVAMFFANECSRKVTLRREGSHLVSSTMRESMQKLPTTGYMWRMAFGLMTDNQKTKEAQQSILKELVEEAKLLDSLSPFDITNLCVEAIYESQNAGTMTDLLEEFTLNQTIRYSNEYLAPSRRSYAVNAVGYLVRSSGSVYGVHMSQFGLCAKTIGMLADPVNDVSDNNLQVLNISNNPLGPSGMKGLLRFLVKATLLSHLDLGSCNLGNVGVALLSEFFMCMPLRYLRLSENGISDPGVKRMVRNLKYVPTLEWLDLSDNKITDKGTNKLGEALSVLPHLRSLDLTRNKISDEGVGAISTHLDQLNNVAQLMLSENKIGEKGASKLSAHLWKTKSLRFVNLTLNNIPAEGIMGLKRAANEHGDLHISVSPDAADTTVLSEDELVLSPEDSMALSPKPSTSSVMTKSSIVNLLDGRDADFDKRRPLRRSWSGRGSFRRSWHGVSNSLKRNDAI